MCEKEKKTNKQFNINTHINNKYVFKYDNQYRLIQFTWGGGFGVLRNVLIILSKCCNSYSFYFYLLYTAAIHIQYVGIHNIHNANSRSQIEIFYHKYLSFFLSKKDPFIFHSSNANQFQSLSLYVCLSFLLPPSIARCSRLRSDRSLLRAYSREEGLWRCSLVFCPHSLSNSSA